MFLILVNYKKALDIVDKYLSDHRSFLDEGYKKNFFVVSGPREPRTGGIIISQLKDRSQLEKILNQDPFHIHDIASYEIIEFMPAKCHKNFLGFVENK